MEDGKSEVEGCRVICDGHYGTVKFFGEVPPASGLWYGIEWDEDGRGKHSGEHEGVKYFNCSRPCSGSFVRAKKVDFGVSDVEALMKKFDELHSEEELKEQQFFYRVGRDGVRSASVEEKLMRLKYVNLRWTNVSRSSNEKSLGSVAPNIVELDLSKTLLSDWQEVLKIIKDLHRLTKLDVSENRLSLRHLERNVIVLNHIETLKTLVANKMNLDWQQAVALPATFGDLEELHVSFNSIQSLKGEDLCSMKKLKRLNLEGNYLSDWNDILLLQVLPVLETLVLSDNKLDKISFPGPVSESSQVFCNLKCLSLTKTMISSWSSINQLNRLAALEELKLKECPLVKSISEYEARLELIARVAKCSKLNQTEVTVKERQAAERAYLKKYGKDWLASGGNLNNLQSSVNSDFMVNHPRYMFLLQRHGVPEGVEMLPSTAIALKDNLVVVTIACVNDVEKQSVMKKLPCTMTISKLKGLLQRIFKIQPVRQSLFCVDQTGHEIEMDDDLRQLSFYSVKSGDTIKLKW